MSKKPINSKQKGNSFEREMSKKISMWISNGKRDDLIWRSHNSGGRFTMRKKLGKKTHDQEGDLTSTHPDSKLFTETFCIECKCYAKVDLYNILYGRGQILKWWKKLLEDCGIKCPMLIIKQNYKPIIILTMDCFIQKLGVEFIAKIPYQNSSFIYVIDFNKFITTKYNEKGLKNGR